MAIESRQAESTKEVSNFSGEGTSALQKMQEEVRNSLGAMVGSLGKASGAEGSTNASKTENVMEKTATGESKDFNKTEAPAKKEDNATDNVPSKQEESKDELIFDDPYNEDPDETEQKSDDTENTDEHAAEDQDEEDSEDPEQEVIECKHGGLPTIALFDSAVA